MMFRNLDSTHLRRHDAEFFLRSGCLGCLWIRSAASRHSAGTPARNQVPISYTRQDTEMAQRHIDVYIKSKKHINPPYSSYFACD
jgi:hypothetical protein